MTHVRMCTSVASSRRSKGASLGTGVRREEIFAESTREPFSSGLAIILLSGLGPGSSP